MPEQDHLQLIPQNSLLSDHGYLLIQAFFQVLLSYSWGFALIQSLSEQSGVYGYQSGRSQVTLFNPAQLATFL